MALSRKDLRQELAAYPTRKDLRQELAAYPTREELRSELARSATKEDLAALEISITASLTATLQTTLAPYATKSDVSLLREEMAQRFAEMRGYMEVLIEDVRSWTTVLVDGASARALSLDARLTTAAVEHDRRLDHLETRVTRLEKPRRRSRK